jgi:hypothetical protein
VVAGLHVKGYTFSENALRYDTCLLSCAHLSLTCLFSGSSRSPTITTTSHRPEVSSILFYLP